MYAHSQLELAITAAVCEAHFAKDEYTREHWIFYLIERLKRLEDPVLRALAERHADSWVAKLTGGAATSFRDFARRITE